MKTKVLFYCTKAKPNLWSYETYYGYEPITAYDINIPKEHIKYIGLDKLNGKIVCECEVECESFEWWSSSREDCGYFNEKGKNITDKLLRDSCLTYEQLFDYIGGTNLGYALHISNLKMFDKPLWLGELEYRRTYNIARKTINITKYLSVSKAPQNMMWVWYKGERHCLISIRPEWLCKILNGEKTIEVRKKILKGMM